MSLRGALDIEDVKGDEAISMDKQYCVYMMTNNYNTSYIKRDCFALDTSCQGLAMTLVLFFTLSFSSLAVESDTATGFIELGIKFYEKMEYQKAKDYFLQAKVSRPKREYKKFTSYALLVLEKYSARLKEIEGLNAKLKAATEETEKKALIEKLKTAHFDMGRCLLEKGGYVAVIKSHFGYIISQDPVNLEAYLYLGDINYLGMLYDEAIKNYKKALELYPDNLFFQQRLGDIYVGIGNYDEAKKSYSEAIGLLKKSKLEDKKEKIEYLKRLTSKLPTSLDDIKALMDKQLYADVVTLCKKRTAMNPSDVTAITYMGIAFEELGQWQQAEKLYKTAIKRNLDYPTPHFYLAKVYLTNRKDIEKTIEEIETFKGELQELLEIDKQAKEGLIAAQHTLVYIYHEILRDYKTAIQESKYLLELAPNDQEAHYNLALSYAYLDKKSMAYDEFKKVIDINPDTKIARYAKDAIEYMQKYPSMRTLPYRPIEE